MNSDFATAVSAEDGTRTSESRAVCAWRVPALNDVHPSRALGAGWRGVATGGKAKRFVDAGVAGAALALSAPLWAVAAVLVRLSSKGPVLLPERLIGFRGQSFLAWRFRTVHVAGEDGALAEDDLHFTGLGRLLRATGIDLTPRLWNVLKGEMSLVGPRAHAPGDEALFAMVAAEYWARQRARPGLTGLAQVRRTVGGPNEPDALAGELACDLEYLRRWSPWLDLGVLARAILHLRAA